MTRELKSLVLATMLAGGAGFGCGGEAPNGPSPVAVKPAFEGAARAANAPPNLIWRSSPRADLKTVPYPTISGLAPLTVRFNLCNSDDADEIRLPDGTQDPRGDSLNWQFYFGDTRPVPGPMRPDFEHFCRVEHTYPEGRYEATLVVTDKHVEDQSRGVASLARRELKLTIEALPLAPPAPAPAQGGSCSIVAFTVEPTGSADARRSRASSTLANYTAAWSAMGSVSAVSLSTPADGTLTGLPASGTAGVSEGCGTYQLVVSCGDGSTVQDTVSNPGCS